MITRYLYKPTAAEGNSHFNDNKRLHIFVVDVATGKSRQLTNGVHYEHSIDWSPGRQGDRLRFESRAQTTINFSTTICSRSIPAPAKPARSPPPKAPSIVRIGRPTENPSSTKPPSAASPTSKPPWKTPTSGGWTPTEKIAAKSVKNWIRGRANLNFQMTDAGFITPLRSTVKCIYIDRPHPAASLKQLSRSAGASDLFRCTAICWHTRSRRQPIRPNCISSPARRRPSSLPI